MNITITIMGHPKRRDAIDRLFDQLSYMPFYRVVNILDNNNDEWTTGRRALRSGVGIGDWHVVIQDDAVLTDYFYDNIESAIKGLPSKSLFSLYTGTSRPLKERVQAAVDKAADGEWLESHQLYWGVGVVLPTDHIEPMLDFVENIELPYDNKIGEFYCQNKLPIYYCQPSLVDHHDELGSLLGHGQSPEPRIAHRLATELVRWSNKRYYI